jgi:predicted metal-dependent HD superfamily phosphohydrolase
VDKYNEPHRKWHNLSHIQDVYRFVAMHPQGGRARQVLDAIFHDVVYDPLSKTNEEDSYVLAQHALMAFQTPDERPDFIMDPEMSEFDYRKDGILATKRHESDDPEIQVLLDADLEVLSRPWDGYWAYVQAIREEYLGAGVDPAAFDEGRPKFMRHFLEREKIYFTEFMKDNEPLARDNIRREIALAKTET